MIKNYKVKLHVLTPIHIGMGDAYDPTQFVIDKDGLMYVFDTNDFLKSLDAEKSMEFCKLADNANNPVPVFRFFRENFDKTKIKYREVKVSKDLCERYEQICKSGSLSKEAINQFELKRTIYNPIKGVPYIPGSSLKGCLKTIWMSEVNKKTSQIKDEKDIKKLELAILKGTFNKDPFRLFKVSDLYPIGNKDASQTEIKYAVMFPRKDNKKQRGDLTVALEVISKGQIFEGIITINDMTGIPKNSKPLHNVKMEDLVKCSAGFYGQKIKLGNKFLASKGAVGLSISPAFQSKFMKTCFPICLGHHSGAELITIDDNRRIKISPPSVKPKDAIYKPYSTTFWLASNKRKPESPKGLVPFGWVMLEFEEIK